MSKLLRIVIVFLICFLAVFLFQFVRSYMISRSPARMREIITTSAKSSCVQKATAKAAGTAVTSTQVNDYCDCVTQKGVGSFSDTEIAAAANRGANPSESDMARVIAATKLCNAQVFPSN